LYNVAVVAHLAGYGQLSGFYLQLFGDPLGAIFFLILTPPIYRLDNTIGAGLGGHE
jgi:hypothetical protein